MNNFFHSLFFCALLTSTSMAMGTEQLSTDVRGADMTVIREYFSHFKRKVQQPFYLYHWRRSPGLVQLEDAQINAQKYGRNIVEEDAPKFIPGLYVTGRTGSAMYGGGASCPWALLVMHIPIDFQMLDLRIPEPQLTEVEKDQLKQALFNFNCPAYTKYRHYLSVGLLSADSLSSPCADMITSLITALKVDGFLYDYMTTNFRICQSNTDRNAAIVFTSSRWLNKTGADARVYTTRTTADYEERQMIESIFLFHATYQSIASKTAAVLGSLITKITKESLLRDYDIITKGFPSRFSGPAEEETKKLHWNDLLSQETAKDPKRWIQENIFECGGTNFLAGPSQEQP